MTHSSLLTDLKEPGCHASRRLPLSKHKKMLFSEALDSTLASKADVLSVKTDVAMLDAKVDKLSWMMGILIALAVANFAKQFF